MTTYLKMDDLREYKSLERNLSDGVLFLEIDFSADSFGFLTLRALFWK